MIQRLFFNLCHPSQKKASGMNSVTKSRTHVTKLYTPVTKRRTPVTKLIELRYGIARYNVTECFEDLILGYVLQAGRLRNR